MIHRYGPCWMITLFRFLRWKVELGYAPADYSPPPHSHPNSSGEFTVLYSRNRRIWRKVGDRVDEYVASIPKVWGRFLSVRSGTEHGFDRGESCMIWLCFETWKPGVKVTSVAEDLVPT